MALRLLSSRQVDDRLGQQRIGAQAIGHDELPLGHSKGRLGHGVTDPIQKLAREQEMGLDHDAGERQPLDNRQYACE